MKLREFLQKHLISPSGTIELRLVNHPDYLGWKESNSFPGYTGDYWIKKSSIVVSFDSAGDDDDLISLDIEGVEDISDDLLGFLYLHDWTYPNGEKEQCKLVFYS